MKLDRLISIRSNKTIFRDGDRRIKVFNSDFTKADVLNEALNQARIEETGLNIPKIQEVTIIDGKWAIVSDYIKGKTLAQLMEENPERKNEYIDLMVELQMQIHSNICPLLNKLKDKMNRMIICADLEATVRYDLHMQLENMPRHSKLCHGDFNPSNVIVTDEGVPYIIDWSHATQGNAAADVARTYLMFLLNGDKDGAKYYLDLFCVRSQTEPEYVHRWMPLVAAAQSVKGNEHEREFLLSIVRNPDFE